MSKGRSLCVICFNALRRSRYAKSVCKKCLNEFEFSKSGNRSFCSEKCRFMDKVLIDNSGCWFWNGYIQKDGFGCFVRSGQKNNNLAHRVSYVLFKNDLNNTETLEQGCGNRSCVNADHLSIKTELPYITCTVCNIKKDRDLYFNGKYNSCNDCRNIERGSKYRQSICVQCEKEYKSIGKGSGKFCSDQCRFVDKVKISPKTECWIWKGSINDTGYGSFSMKSKRSESAHRASYKLFVGSIKTDMHILQSCDMPFCVAPKHLRQGTPMDNRIDLKERGVSKWKTKIGDLIYD